MTHPLVLEVFGGKIIQPNVLGITDIRFPSNLQACQWAQLWKKEIGSEPDVSLMSHGCSLFRPVIVTVRG